MKRADEVIFTKKEAEVIQELWTDPSAVTSLARSSEFDMLDSTPYYFPESDRQHYTLH